MPSIKHGTGLTIRGPNSSDIDFTLSAEEFDIVLTAPSSSVVTIDDYDFNSSSTGSKENGFNLSVDGDVPFNWEIELSSSDESVAVITNGKVVRVADGQATIIARTPWLSRSAVVDMLRETNVTVNDPIGYTSGSLGKDIFDGTETAAGSGTKPIFSSINHSTSAYVRNASNWVGANWTGRPVWNEVRAGLANGALISPRHLLAAKHLPPGGDVRFVLNDNTVVTRTINATSDVSGTDIRICRLDSDVPSTVAHYKVLPANWRNYLITLDCPAILTDRDQNALAREWTSITSSRFLTSTYSMSPLNTLSENIVGGDSGSAAFLLVGGNLVLSGANYLAGGGLASHDFVSDYITQINAAMTTLGGGYQLETVDLSGFTDFS